jgi:hypothetical protein
VIVLCEFELGQNCGTDEILGIGLELGITIDEHVEISKTLVE